MKVLIIGDVPDWAIGKLTKSIVRHNGKCFQILEHYVHPKHVSEHVEETRSAVAKYNPDVIHFQYWNTARQLLEQIPELRKYNSILTHHNQKDLLSADWKALGINQHVVHTEYSKKTLEAAGYSNIKIIRHGLDFSKFPFAEQQTGSFVGYAGRVVPWKGLKEIAEVCEELDVPLAMMGKIDKPDYWASIRESARERMDMNFVSCEDDERIDFYRSLAIYVGNSGDGREEGTLPYLEAMAAGVPVITTPSGEAADFAEDGRNALVVPFGDRDALKTAIKRLWDDKELADTLRRNAWNTVKNLDERVMAWEYGKLYYATAYPGKPLVSVIIPFTKDRAEQVDKIIEALSVQTYSPIEAIPILDDEDGYNLAKVRNIAAINAYGEFLLFCDSRFIPNPDAVEIFVKKLWMDHPNDYAWLFGDKGGHKENFVENFSFIRRKDYIEGGMSCERVNQYGGMSQELRERFGRQGCKFIYIPEAVASTIHGTHHNPERRAGIIDMKVMLHKMDLF